MLAARIAYKSAREVTMPFLKCGEQEVPGAMVYGVGHGRTRTAARRAAVGTYVGSLGVRHGRRTRTARKLWDLGHFSAAAPHPAAIPARDGTLLRHHACVLG